MAFSFTSSKPNFKFQDFICRVHKNYMEAVTDSEILKSQPPSNNAQKYV